MRAALYRAAARMVIGATILMSATVHADRVSAPFAFFEGITESVGTLDILMRKPTATRAVGRGEIRPDGSLSLVQRVEDEGRSPHLRYWLIRQLAPGHFSGSMSEASGPVTIDRVGTRYRFRFKISGGMAVEQWLTPSADGRSASSDMTVRRFGIAVASARATVRKVY
jgi:hypothetical protein